MFAAFFPCSRSLEWFLQKPCFPRPPSGSCILRKEALKSERKVEIGVGFFDLGLGGRELGELGIYFGFKKKREFGHLEEKKRGS